MVNMAKNQIDGIQNGGPLRINEKVYFNGDLHWNIAIQNFTKNRQKGLFYVLNYLENKCGALPKNIAFQMFDSKVLPILCLWFPRYGEQKMWSEIENCFIANFCKYVLGFCPVFSICGCPS